MHYGYPAMKWLDIEATNANFASLKFRATLQASPILQYFYTPRIWRRPRNMLLANNLSLDEA